MRVAIIENSDDPELAEFLTNEDGGRLLFVSHEAADNWLMDNAERGVAYLQYDGE